MELKHIIHASLFSGIGGFDLAAEWIGWHNEFHCEWNPFGQKILKHYWPNSKSYEDITKTDFTIHRGTIDILTGGFPCQPYSVAGKRKGKEDERHLWPEMLRAIREIQPTYVVGENVGGIVSWNRGMVFDEVQSDLEAQGYEVQPFILPACAKNAPHRRDRVWFIAYSEDCGRGRRKNKQCTDGEREILSGKFERCALGNKIKGCSGERNVAYTNCQRCDNRSDNRKKRHVQTNIGIAKKDKPKRHGRKRGISTSCTVDADTDGVGLRRQSYGIRKSRQSNQKSQIDDWKNFPTQPPICGGDDGLPTELDGITFPKWRNESIKGYGNAIVPQIALEIFKAINTHSQSIKPTL